MKVCFLLKIKLEMDNLLLTDDSNHLSLLTDVLSERPNEELVVSGDIELSNTDKIQFMTVISNPLRHY